MKNFLKLLFFGISSAPVMILEKPGKKEQVKAQFGFSLSLLFLCPFFGLPLLSRRLWGWAAVMFVLSTVQIWETVQRFSLILSATSIEQIEALEKFDPIDSVLDASLLVLSVLLALKGNEWTVRNLLKKGWHFADPQDPLVLKAAKKWRLSKHYMKRKPESL